MSLYNLVMGTDPTASAVLQALGFTKETVGTIPRFRDAYIDVEGDEPRLVIFTRTGGNNRIWDQEDGTAPVDVNEDLRELPGFIDDWDDEFDNTFAHWRYAVPEEYKEFIAALVAEGRKRGYEFPRPMDRMQAFLKPGGQ